MIARRGYRCSASSLGLALLFAGVASPGGGLGERDAHAESAARWQLKIPERIELVAGASGSLPIEILLERGLSVSKDAAVIVDLAPDAALAIKRRRLGRADAVDPDADAPRFAVAVRAEAPGDYGIRVRVRFWVCGSKVCRPVEARRNVTVAVAASPPPAGDRADTLKFRGVGRVGVVSSFRSPRQHVRLNGSCSIASASPPPESRLPPPPLSLSSSG